MSIESEVAVLKEKAETHLQRINAHGVMIEKVEDLTNKNANAISGVLEALGLIKRVVYGCVGIVMVAVAGELFKLIFKN